MVKCANALYWGAEPFPLEEIMSSKIAIAAFAALAIGCAKNANPKALEPAEAAPAEEAAAEEAATEEAATEEAAAEE